jgi:hypothetical protein
MYKKFCTAMSVLFIASAAGIVIFIEVTGLHLTQGEKFVCCFPAWVLVVVMVFIGWYFFPEDRDR